MKRYRKRNVLAGAVLTLAVAASADAFAEQHSGSMPPAQDGMMMGQGMSDRQVPMIPGVNRLMAPQMDPARGRRLFASKGCVACHAINGVGGHDATPLDAHTMDRAMNPFDFAAKMWRMAPAMIYAQEEALGEQILFTGDELADIIAFVHHDDEQHKFSEADIPSVVRRWMDHAHGQPGGGDAAHSKELGHYHGAGEKQTQ